MTLDDLFDLPAQNDAPGEGAEDQPIQMGAAYRTPYDIMSELDAARARSGELVDYLSTAHTAANVRFLPSSAAIKVQETDAAGNQTTRVVGTCLRRAYYLCVGVQPTEARTARANDSADLGNMVESIYLDRFRNLSSFRVVAPSVDGRKLRYRHDRISGEVDMVLLHIPSGNLVGVEMKSYDGPWKAWSLCGYDESCKCHGKFFFLAKYVRGSRSQLNPNWVSRNDYDFHGSPVGPGEQNLLQTMLYLDEFGKDALHPIRLWKLVYIARDKGPRAEFDVTLAEDGGDKYPVVNGRMLKSYPLSGIYARYAELERHVLDAILPPRDFVPEYDSQKLLADNSTPAKVVEKLKNGGVHRDWQCGFCPYLGRCEADGA